jgi:hypothetical protein
LGGKMSDDNRTSGMGFWTDANEMLQAAKHLMTVKQLALSQPLYFLLEPVYDLSASYLSKSHLVKKIHMHK